MSAPTALPLQPFQQCTPAWPRLMADTGHGEVLERHFRDLQTLRHHGFASEPVRNRSRAVRAGRSSTTGRSRTPWKSSPPTSVPPSVPSGSSITTGNGSSARIWRRCSPATTGRPDRRYRRHREHLPADHRPGRGRAEAGRRSPPACRCPPSRRCGAGCASSPRPPAATPTDNGWSSGPTRPSPRTPPDRSSGPCGSVRHTGRGDPAERQVDAQSATSHGPGTASPSGSGSAITGPVAVSVRPRTSRPCGVSHTPRPIWTGKVRSVSRRW